MIVVAILITGFAQAQKLKESEIPKTIKESFTKLFPNAKEVKWSKESDTELEAEFETAGKEQSANFDLSGKWMGTETEIEKSELPKSVTDAIAKDFAGYKIEEAEKAETPDKGKFYEVELEKGKVTYEVQFSAEGKVMKKEEKKEKKEKDEDKD